MCGRFSQYWGLEQWNQAWPVDWHVSALAPRYNVAPGTPILSIVSDSLGHPVGGFLDWGLRTARGLIINARAETVESRPTFRPLLERGRCVVPMNGYYEWHQDTRQPYYMEAGDGEPLWALGLYDTGPQGSRAVILTRPAASGLDTIHPRMPVLADASGAQAWLSRPRAQCRDILDVLMHEAPLLHTHPVGRRVNKSSQDGPDLIQPLPNLMP